MPAIADVLGPMLDARYKGSGLRLLPKQNTVAIFPPKHPEVGELEIIEDGDEVIVMLGKFTHSHFGCYEKGLTPSQHAEQVASSVIEFLDDLFSDQIEFFGKGAHIGGWRYRGREKKGILARLFGRKKFFVWSGPL